MNRLKEHANIAQAAVNEEQSRTFRDQRETRITELEQRAAVAESEPFRRMKVKTEEMLADAYRAVMDCEDSLKLYRWQGAERALRGLLAHYEGARSELMTLQQEQADDAVSGSESAPA